MEQLVWLIPVLPLVGFLLISFFKKWLPGQASGILASAMVLGSFVVSLCLFFQLTEPVTVNYFDWIQSGSLNIPVSFLVDHISTVMLLIITGVGFLIHVYSIGYMHHDEAFARFFAHLNLFVFFMLILVLGSNYVMMFIGWEGVGLCSYLLIGFWFKNTEYNKAANKAFIMNRIGDLGFLLGMILIFMTFGSLSFSEVFSGAAGMAPDTPVMIAITALLFVGAMGKSAQIPLYTWLPDAMAGPTPVSALIHAATMVTAGVYMVVRSNVLYTLAPATLAFVAIIGTVTALFAGTIALAQTDIKKVLAYSTVSQLGYMFAALGAGAYASGLFHVTTHAFFKALLFLAAGSVIHAMSGEQDIRRMGGLKKKLPITFLVFLIGTLAIAGVPPFAGFFSKDEILAAVYSQNKFLFVLLAATSVITAYYMFRVLLLTFYGSFRGTHEQEHHLHESPKVMTVPLLILAVLSTIGGFMGLPPVFSEHHTFSEYLAVAPGFAAHEHSHAFEYTLMGTAIAVILIVWMAAYNRFVKRATIPAADEKEFNAPVKVLYNKYYVDEIYNTILVKPLDHIAQLFHQLVDNKLIDGIVNSTGTLTNSASGLLRRAQTGHIGFYIFAMVVSIAAILLLNLFVL